MFLCNRLLYPFPLSVTTVLACPICRPPSAECDISRRRLPEQTSAAVCGDGGAGTEPAAATLCTTVHLSVATRLRTPFCPGRRHPAVVNYSMPGQARAGVGPAPATRSISPSLRVSISPRVAGRGDVTETCVHTGRDRAASRPRGYFRPLRSV